MFDVALYGHLTVDRIFTGFKRDCTIGSMGNVWKYLNKISPNLKIHLEPTDIGEALIYIDKNKSERFSIANLSIETKTPTIVNSRWSHIMYLNEISDYGFIEKMKNTIVSADLCRGKKIENLKILKNIDYLFLADEDCLVDPTFLCKQLKKGIVLHCSNGSVFYDNKANKTRFSVQLIKNLNVLGCGDMFAAGVIDSMLSGNTITKSIEKSHKLLSNFLLNKRN